MTQEEIEELKLTIVTTPKAFRLFVFEKLTAPGEEVQRSISLTAMRVFGEPQFLTLLASEQC